MKTATAGMIAHLAQRSHTRCWMLLLDLSDASTIAITDHNKDLDFDIGDGTETYLSGTGFKISNVSLSAGLEPDNFEVTGPIADTVTRAGLLGGRYNRARARLFMVNWKALGDGSLKFVDGDVGEARLNGGEFVFEIRSVKDRLNQVVGRILANNCSADYADQIQCFATPTDITGTVTAVTDAMRFTVSYSGGPYADAFFDKGTLRDFDGANTGNTPVEVYAWDDNGDGTADVTLFAPLGVEPDVGDTMTVRDGCAKTRAACMAHGQILNARAFFEVPGSDQVLKPAIPAQGSSGGGGKGK